MTAEKIKPEERKKLRDRLRKKKPHFRRQNYKHYKALTGWRCPRGIHNKLKKHHAGKGSLPAIGYKTPAEVRGLHPSGYEEVLLFNPDNIQYVDAETQAVKIGATVGKKKREIIIQKAETLNIKVLNK